MGMNSMYSTNRIRFGGLASGLDTDSIVRDLMRIEQMKVDKLKQEKQVLEWQKEDYRNTTNLLRGFYDEYFDILYAKTNMTSASTYNTLKIESSNAKYLTATASPGAHVSSKTITEISLAKAAYVEGKSASAQIRSSELSGSLSLEGQSIIMTVDGVTRRIELGQGDSGDYADLEAFANYLEEQIAEAFGHDPSNKRVQVSVPEGEGYLTIESNTSAITINDYIIGEEGTDLGFSANQSNRIDLDSTLIGLELTEQFDEALNLVDNTLSFTINGVDFTFSGNDTLRTVMNRINNSNAGVTLTYNSLTDRFSLTNKNTGAAQTLTFDDSQSGGNFLKALGLKADGAQVNQGKDAMMTIDGITLYRSTNNFTIDGVTYNLNQDFKLGEGIEPINLTMVRDVDQAFDNIKSFVEAYNKILDTLNETISQERFRDFLPLTDEQREAMSEKEIELWEEKARSGLLQRDPILQKIVYDMRRAMVDSVKDIGINLSSIGITTGSYTEGGRLHINETKLKDALRQNGDEVMRLFNNKSEIAYSPDNDSIQRSQRYGESGLVHRLSDILQDNIRTRRNKDGRKGILLEKAGIVGDATERVNLMDDQLKDMNRRIETAVERMVRAENRYWAQFTALETALARMSSQSMWLAQQFGGGMY